MSRRRRGRDKNREGMCFVSYNQQILPRNLLDALPDCLLHKPVGATLELRACTNTHLSDSEVTFSSL